jgi:hypothetical protein
MIKVAKLTMSKRDDSSDLTDWQALSAQASLASHRLVGWIYWDPDAISCYAKLGVENGLGYYIASRCAPLASAGDEVVIAACYSIHADFIRLALKLARENTTFEDAYRVRNEAVVRGLNEYVKDLVDDLGKMSGDLWQAAESLPLSGRVLYAAHLAWPRCEDQPALSAWLAINCIREWRGDTHWAILAAHNISGVQAGLLHDAFLGYPGDWIPRSRGANDAQLDEAWSLLDQRGYVTDRKINSAGLEFRQQLEDMTNQLSERAWRNLGEEKTKKFCDLVLPHSKTLLSRIDQTAGENWMPAARDSRRK